MVSPLTTREAAAILRHRRVLPLRAARRAPPRRMMPHLCSIQSRKQAASDRHLVSYNQPHQVLHERSHARGCLPKGLTNAGGEVNSRDRSPRRIKEKSRQRGAYHRLDPPLDPRSPNCHTSSTSCTLAVRHEQPSRITTIFQLQFSRHATSNRFACRPSSRRCSPRS